MTGSGTDSASLSVTLAHDVAVRPWRSTVGAAVISLAGTTVAVAVADAVLPGFTVQYPGGAVAFAAVATVVTMLAQPLMVGGSVRLGWWGVLLVAVLGQAAVAGLSARLMPRVEVDGFWTAFAVGWVVGTVATLVGWLTSSGTDAAFVSRLVRNARRHPSTVADPEREGVVFVQLDGVPFPVMQFALMAGTVPTLSRWIRSGGHQLHEWTPKLPATTPASQMGILHGVIDGIPAFRWYDREHDRVLVANHPADAVDIEASMTTGRGLLVDGGVSISNLFSGDAPEAVLTMSRRNAGGESTRRGAAQFVSRPDGLVRAVSRTLAELTKERFQARRAIRRDVQPRVHRNWTFAALRAVTNGGLRDLNTALVSEHMLRGTRAIYVDYVDYDEIAHHAGILRPESLAALEAVDGVLRQLEMVAQVTPRPYRFVVLSDHGQSQGAVFADRYGEDLATVVARLAKAEVAVFDQDVEGWGRTKVLVDDLAAGDGVTARTMRSASGAMARQGQDQADSVGPTDKRSDGTDGDETFHVFGSGNLGLIYVRGEQTRLMRQHLDARFPALVSGLAAHPGVGFVVVSDEQEGPIALGAEGSRRLRDGLVLGKDPLEPFGDDAPSFVLRVAERPEAPDIYVNSLLDPGTGEVAAFEGLVGCHGGLGGWQDRAMVVIPTDLPFPTDRIQGADSLHHVLVGVLEHLGHREGLGVTPGSPDDVAVQDPAERPTTGPDGRPIDGSSTVDATGPARQ